MSSDSKLLTLQPMVASATRRPLVLVEGVLVEEDVTVVDVIAGDDITGGGTETAVIEKIWAGSRWRETVKNQPPESVLRIRPLRTDLGNQANQTRGVMTW